MNKKSKMKTSLLVSILVAASAITSLAGLQLVSSVKAAGYTEYTGMLSGAPFAVRFPDQWNGMLAVVCRGYSPTLVTDARSSINSSQINAILNQGFAVAASAYGAKGYCVGRGMNDTFQLTTYLKATYHITGKVFLIGMSMGGNIALLLGVKYPDVYSGVIDMYGTKDLKNQYETKIRWTNLTDTALTAELTALTAPIPPFPFSSLSAIRSFCRLASSDIALETGGIPTNASKAYEDVSPVYHANIAVPIITVHGTSDVIVPFYESISYQSSVARAGCSNLYRLYNVTGGQHANSLVNAEIPGRFAELVTWTNQLTTWALVNDGRAVKAYPNLREYVWEKNATLPPNGQYDKISLHRLVRTETIPRGVILVCPGTNGNAEQLFSNPTDENWTKYENYSQPIYWANRGYDVYGIDYRTHFVPTSLNDSQLSFMANWGYDQWMSDMKEAVEKVKEVSGYERIFLAGISFGGNVVMNHAAKYWQYDLKGIILLDAGPGTSNPNPANTFNLTTALAQMNEKKAWASEMGAPFKGSIFIMKYALENPGAPATVPLTNEPLYPPVNPITNKTWANITEWAQNYFRSATSNTNFTGGYGDYRVMMQFFATSDRYWPARLTLERNAWWNWTNCPYVAYDYDDHYSGINVPLLGFTSQNYGVKSWGKVSRGIASYDVTGIFLPYYGHLDVFMGRYSARDVSQPALNWMVGEVNGLKATAFTDVTLPPGWTWNFFVHDTGGVGTHTYQWYQDNGMLQGQTTMILPVTKNTPGTYTFYCKVTDAEGGTTNSNAVTLTVSG